MASVFGSFGRPSLMIIPLLAAGGCGESFVAHTGGGGSGGDGGSAGNGGSPSTTAPVGGGSTTTTAPGKCEDGAKQPCYEGPANTKHIGICRPGMQVCTDGAWGECKGQVLPKPEELCNNDGKDEDCDGSAEEGCGCDPGTSEDCYGGNPATLGVGPCKAGTKVCADGVWGECKGQVKPTDEICDLIDNDCDGTIDNDAADTGAACETGIPGDCSLGMSVCSGQSPGFECAPIHTPEQEICDGHDNDCDGVVDNLAFQACQIDVPGPSGATTCGGYYKCGGSFPTCAPFSYFADDFGGNNSLWGIGPEWQIGPMPSNIAAPGQGNPDPPDDHSPTADKRLAGVVLGGNTGILIHGSYYLTSPPIDAGGAPSLYLSYWRYLNTGPFSQMPHTVEVASDGVNFVKIWANGEAPIYDDAWTLMVHDVSAFKSQVFRVRFGFAINDIVSLVSASSWNIDDVAVSSCPPPGFSP